MLPDDDPTELRQSRENREKIKQAARCIWCGACISSCNILKDDEYYLGPVPIVKGYRFFCDEREAYGARDPRLARLSQEHDVWRCQTRVSCTEACPTDIPITE